MKKLTLYISLLALSLSLSACNKQRLSDLKDGKTQNIADLPEWVIDPSVSEGVAAVGIASKSRGGIAFQIPRAELDAKANIAAQIQSEISRITKNALRSADVNGSDDVETVFTQATKDVIKNMPMSGVKRLNMYQGADGTLYIRMILKNEDYSRYLQNSQKVYEARLRQANLSRDNLNKSQEAVKELFEELDEERGTNN